MTNRTQAARAFEIIKRQRADHDDTSRIHGALARLARRLGTDEQSPAADAMSNWRQRRPVPGWNARANTTALSNPRPPAVPASLELTLEEYYAAAATIGLLAAQEVEPDAEWASKWSLDYGQRMAREARRRRTRKRR